MTEPTDEEIMELMPQQMRDDLAAAARALAGFDRANVKVAAAYRIILNRHAVDHARAVLAEYGRPTPQPVAVSERLPGPEDCDEIERCWWWRPSHCESGYEEGWMLRPHAWGSGRYDFDDRLMHTHWLPANALPIPEATND